MGRSLVGLVRETVQEYLRDDVPRLGAALAYYTVFSIAPVLVIVIAIAGAVFGADAARGAVATQLRTLIGPEGASVIERAIAASDHGGTNVIAAIIGVITLLVGATGAFAELQQALNTVWGAKPAPSGGWLHAIRQRVASFAMVLVLGFLLVVSTALSAAISGLATLVSRAVDIGAGWFYVVDQIVSLGLVTLLFAAIYKVLPDVKVAWRDVWVGSLATAVLLDIGRLLIGLYLGNSSVASTFGAAGSLVVLLLWVYYAAQIVLLGAEFTEVFSRRHGSRSAPTPA